MKCYLVGGAVRDRLLGLPERERDWLVLEATPEQLLKQGFLQVGRNFPIFLHPQTREEHALPRGGDGDGDPMCALERDLQLRDLTINAMALGPDGVLIDPLGGKRDLEQRILRHTPGFAEDPLRVLRLARLHARLAHLGFRPAQETLDLSRELVRGERFSALAPERLWQEIQRALAGPDPVCFFVTLRSCGALRRLMPELEHLFGVPQPLKPHPEGDSGRHSLMALQQACRLSERPEIRFAALVHDLGKGATPEHEWPRHIGHESRGVPLVEQLCQRLGVPNEYRELACLTARHHLECHNCRQLKPKTVLRLLLSLDALRRPQRLQDFLLACCADARGRSGFEATDYPQAEWMLQAREAVLSVDAGALARQTTDRRKLPQILQQERIRALREWRHRQQVTAATGLS